MNLSLIIIHWNTPGLLRKQLKLLSSNGAKGTSSLQIIVIDNASDKPLTWIKKEFPYIKLIENKKNIGYAAACNQGANLAKKDWLLFLNPDVEITRDSINQLIKSAQEHSFDACSPRSSSMGYQKPLPTPLSLLTEFTPLHRLIPLDTFKEKTLFGGCLLIKKSVLKHIGGWDEDFFLWFEDSDLTLRLKKTGFSIGFLQTNISHIGGSSFDLLTGEKRKKIFFNSMNIFAKKHFSIVGRIIVGLIRLRYTV